MASFSSSVTAFFGGDTSGLAKAITRAELLVGGFQRTMASIGLGIGSAAVIAFFKNVMDEAGRIQDLSDRLDVSTDALQAFNAEAAQAGVTSEQVALTWQTAKKSIDELGSGLPAAAAQFKAIGLSAADFIGLNLEQSLDKIAQGYAKNKDAAGAYQAVTDILGSRSAPKLNAVLLAMGEETLPELIKRQKELGQVIESDTIKKLDEFGDRLQRIKGLATTAGASVLGVFMGLADAIGTAAAGAVNAYEGIGTVLLRQVEEPSKKAGDALKGLGENFEAAAKLQEKLAESAKKVADARAKELPLDERLAKVNEEIVQLYTDLNTKNLSIAEASKVRLEIDEKLLVQIKLQGDVTERNAKKEKDALEEHIELLRRKSELTFEAKTTEEKIATYKASLVEIERLLVLYKKQGLDTTELEVGKLENIKALNDLRVPAEQAVKTKLDEQLAVLQRQLMSREQIVATLREQGYAEDEITKKLESQTKELGMQVTVKRIGREYENQSPEAMEGVKRRLEEQIQDIKRSEFGRIGGVGGKGKPAELYILENELFNLNKAMNERKNVTDYIARYGESAARGQYGDTATDRAMNNVQSNTSKMASDIETLKNLFVNTFGKS